MYNSITHHLYIVLYVHHPKSSLLLSPFISPSPSSPYPRLPTAPLGEQTIFLHWTALHRCYPCEPVSRLDSALLIYTCCPSAHCHDGMTFIVKTWKQVLWILQPRSFSPPKIVLAILAPLPFQEILESISKDRGFRHSQLYSYLPEVMLGFWLGL